MATKNPFQNYSGTHFRYSIEEVSGEKRGQKRAKATLTFSNSSGHNPERVALEARMLFDALSQYQGAEILFETPFGEAAKVANSVYFEADSFSTRHEGDFRDRLAWKYLGARRGAKSVRDSLSTYESVVRPE